MTSNIERVKEIHRVATSYGHKLTVIPTEFLGEVLKELDLANQLEAEYEKRLKIQ